VACGRVAQHLNQNVRGYAVHGKRKASGVVRDNDKGTKIRCHVAPTRLNRCEQHPRILIDDGFFAIVLLHLQPRRKNPNDGNQREGNDAKGNGNLGHGKASFAARPVSAFP
jgi:hypothetical protein